MTAGPYPPDHGTVPSEVTVTIDGERVVVCGVRLTEERARQVASKINGCLLRLDGERWERKRAEEAARWASEAVAVADVNGRGLVRLLPDGRVQARDRLWLADMRPAFDALLAHCAAQRRLWWLGSSGMLHLDGCGCSLNDSFSLARLLPVEEVPAKVCKRTARKLAAEVTP